MIHPDASLTEGTAHEVPTDDNRGSFRHGKGIPGAVAGTAAFLASMPGLSSAAKPAKVVAARKPAVVVARKPVAPKYRPSKVSPPLPGEYVRDLYPGWGRNNFREIQADENAHVAFLLDALGSAARPKPTFQNLVPANFTQFVKLAATFENTGAGAYQGAAPYLTLAYLPAAASIGFVEAFHSGFLNTLLDQMIVPPGGTPNNSFNRALTFTEVADALAPFIASLNDPNNLYPFPTTTPSPANDIAILNFALIAEYLEQEFYNGAVPLFYL